MSIHFGISCLLKPIWFNCGNFIDYSIDLEAKSLNVFVPCLEDVSALKIDDGINLVNVSVHPAFCDHFAGNSLGLFAC